MTNQIQGTYLAAAPITTTTAPSTSYDNVYNANGGALSITLPALSTESDGANFIVEKYTLDGTLNSVTFNCNGGDTFYDGSTSLILRRPGEKRAIQVVTVSGTKYWQVLYGLNPAVGLTAIASEFTLANSNTATTIIGPVALTPATLAAGSTYRFKLLGTVQVKATSGTLTFTPYIQGTALNTIQMASQGSAVGPFGFSLDILATVRTTGTSGTAIAHGNGWINFSTPLMLTTTNTSTTTINTTAAASSTNLYVQATWQNADPANSLKIETATIERVI